MIKSVLNKIANNIWLFICLTVGSLMITAILSSIPTYTDGALRKMLNSELINYQNDNGLSAGQYNLQINLGFDYTSNGVVKLINETKEVFVGGLEKYNIPTTASYESGELRLLSSREDSIEYTSKYDVRYMSGFEDHIELIKGRLPATSIQDGVFEVLVSKVAYNTNTFHIGETYSFTLPMIYDGSAPAVYLKVVGVFDIPDSESDYWYDSADGFPYAFFVNEYAFKESYMTEATAQYLTSFSFYSCIDFVDMDTDDLNDFFEFYNNCRDYIEKFGSGKKKLTFPLRKTILNYVEKGWQVELTMWVFNAPVIVMLGFYLIMVARLIIEEDKNEISALKSRGANPKQIFVRYVIECGIIIIISLIFGPLLGIALAQLIGSANGFLEFVNRSGLTLRLLPSAYFYALCAGLLFLVMVLIPAYQASKSTIVQHKQKKARKKQKPFWQRSFLDIILLVVSVFLLFIYSKNDQMLFSASGSVDPTIYFISTLFIISCGLVFLRIYPLILKLIFALTKKKMSPPVYATFVQVSRGSSDSTSLMLFLILTISIGIYSATCARIINYNVEEEATYKCGADVVVSFDWSELQYSATKENAAEITRLPLTELTSMDYFESTTKVYTTTDTQVKSYYDYEWSEGIRVMGIDPYEFSQIVDFRSSLLDTETEDPIHWYYYLNLMQDYPTSVLVSRGLAEAHDIVVGSTLEVDVNLWGTSEEEEVPVMSCYVLGIIDYWPNYYDGAISTDTVNELVVMNSVYLTSVKSDAEYELWCKLNDISDSAKVSEAISATSISGKISSVRYLTDYISRGKADSMVMALNGSLSLGFVATMVISFVGFLLYWIMNMRKRKLQFGIFRAMGLTRGKVTWMMTLEHLLTSGVSMVMGIVIGNITARLFMPILRQTYSSMIPLKLTYGISDTLSIMAVVGVMILFGVAILGIFISKLKINEAVKIGED